VTDELIRTVGKYALKMGEAWRIGEGAEIMDAYQAAFTSAPAETPPAVRLFDSQAVTDPVDDEWFPTNRYLFRYLCKRIGIELGKDNIAAAISKASAVLVATSAPTASPYQAEAEGWKLVPVVPTDAMAAAAIGASLKNKEVLNGMPQWEAMLAAAPGTAIDAPELDTDDLPIDLVALAVKCMNEVPNEAEGPRVIMGPMVLARFAAALLLRRPRALLRKAEQQAVLDDPNGLACLINYYDCAMAADHGEEPAEMEERNLCMLERQHHLLTLGRTIILRDADIWEEGLKAQFMPRRSEGPN